LPCDLLRPKAPFLLPRARPSLSFGSAGAESSLLNALLKGLSAGLRLSALGGLSRRTLEGDSSLAGCANPTMRFLCVFRRGSSIVMVLGRLPPGTAKISGEGGELGSRWGCCFACGAYESAPMGGRVASRNTVRLESKSHQLHFALDGFGALPRQTGTCPVGEGCPLLTPTQTPSQHVPTCMDTVR
jgi:hypothetical protein